MANSLHPKEKGLPWSSAHELRVALGPSHYHVHPDPHGLWSRSHHEVQAIMGLHTERQAGVGALPGQEDTGNEKYYSTPQGQL